MNEFRMLLLSENRADEGTLSSPGDWQAPLVNLQNRFLRRVARSANLDPADTQFRLDLQHRRSIRGVGVINHNFTTRGRYRIIARRSSDAAGSDARYDSGWQEAYRRVKSWREMRWGDPNFWSGRPTEDDLSGFTRSLIHVLPSTVDADIWSIEIDDQSNPAGFVQGGRLFLAGGSQPAYNYSHGAELGYETGTRIDTSRTGVKYFDRREPRRVQRIVLENLPEQEVFERWLEVHRRMGVDGEVFFIPDPTDDLNMTRRAFYGTLRALPPSQQVQGQLGTIGFEIEESL